MKKQKNACSIPSGLVDPGCCPLLQAEQAWVPRWACAGVEGAGEGTATMHPLPGSTAPCLSLDVTLRGFTFIPAPNTALGRQALITDGSTDKEV